jgi:hypothetical protein
MPRSPRDARAALPGRARELLGDQVAALPVVSRLQRRRPVDLSGWTAPELAAYLRAPKSTLVPPRRAGHEAVAMTNSLSGTLPTEAVLLARAVADAAPPLGHEVSATVADIVDRYLPDTLSAYRNSGPAGRSEASQRLVVDQLRLLHQVMRDVQRAEAEHDDRELRVQEAFLRDRFAQLRDNGLNLPPATSSTPGRPATPTPRPEAGGPRRGMRDLAASGTGSHHRLDVQVHPTAVFNPVKGSDGMLRARFALPKGLPVTVGAVYVRHSGATGFVTATARRWGAKRRQSGFTSAQVDVELQLDLRSIRRFVIHATCRLAGEPIETVLFLSEGPTNTAELPTLLARRRGVATTIVASGFDTSDGLFVRNESSGHANLRAACEAFGFTGITWISADTPAI